MFLLGWCYSHRMISELNRDDLIIQVQLFVVDGRRVTILEGLNIRACRLKISVSEIYGSLVKQIIWVFCDDSMEPTWTRVNYFGMINTAVAGRVQDDSGIEITHGRRYSRVSL